MLSGNRFVNFLEKQVSVHSFFNKVVDSVLKFVPQDRFLQQQCDLLVEVNTKQFKQIQIFHN